MRCWKPLLVESVGALLTGILLTNIILKVYLTYLCTMPLCLSTDYRNVFLRKKSAGGTICDPFSSEDEVLT